MKITLKTNLNQDPIIEVDGRSIVGMDFIEQLNKLNAITNNIIDLPNWFKRLLFAICLEFGETISNNDFETDVFELEL